MRLVVPRCIIPTDYALMLQVIEQSVNIPTTLLIYPHHQLGNIYIADESNYRVRKVTVSTGIISTLAGTGSGAYSGDNGQASNAALNNPAGVAVDSSGIIHP